MLGIGMQEIVIILLVALVVIGPKRLPEVARTLGKGLAEFRKATDDFQESIRKDLEQEKHEDFLKKYPHLENGEEKPAVDENREAGMTTGGASTDSEPGTTYKPEEIEGGVEPGKEPRDA